MKGITTNRKLFTYDRIEDYKRMSIDRIWMARPLQYSGVKAGHGVLPQPHERGILMKKATLSELKKYLEAEPHGRPCPLTEIKSMSAEERSSLLADLTSYTTSLLPKKAS